MDTVAPTSQWTADAGVYHGWFDRPWGRHAATVEHRLLLDAASRATPALGAFQVLTIERPPHPATPQRPKAGRHGGGP